LRWEVACICFYAKQWQAIQKELQGLKLEGGPWRFQNDYVDVVSGTVDRFQGREADLVVLSMKNIQRVGFLDSVNRLNVAVTRARQQLIVVGNADFYNQCGIHELEQLVKQSSVQNGRSWPVAGFTGGNKAINGHRRPGGER
jgi:superfamily I DNA and/or RNA helicase